MWSSVAWLCLWRCIVAAQSTVGWENTAQCQLCAGSRAKSEQTVIDKPEIQARSRTVCRGSLRIECRRALAETPTLGSGSRHKQEPECEAQSAVPRTEAVTIDRVATRVADRIACPAPEGVEPSTVMSGLSITWAVERRTATDSNADSEPRSGGSETEPLFVYLCKKIYIGNYDDDVRKRIME